MVPWSIRGEIKDFVEAELKASRLRVEYAYIEPYWPTGTILDNIDSLNPIAGFLAPMIAVFVNTRKRFRFGRLAIVISMSIAGVCAGLFVYTRNPNALGLIDAFTVQFAWVWSAFVALIIRRYSKRVGI